LLSTSYEKNKNRFGKGLIPAFKFHNGVGFPRSVSVIIQCQKYTLDLQNISHIAYLLDFLMFICYSNSKIANSKNV